MSLRDIRTAIVTGASSGIGAELAAQLAGRGVRVGLIARRAAELDQRVHAIRCAGGLALAACADVADPVATRAAIHQLADSLGPIDLLIANAGIGRATPATHWDPAAIAQVLAINLLGAVNAIAAVLPEMRNRRRGHLVAISSLAGYRGLPGTAAYCASKAGLSTLMESLRLDLRVDGIRVSVAHPGFVQTPMIAAARHPQPFRIQADEAARRILRGVDRQQSWINFPGPMASLMSLVRILPAGVYDRLVLRVMRPSRGDESVQ